MHGGIYGFSSDQACLRCVEVQCAPAYGILYDRAFISINLRGALIAFVISLPIIKYSFPCLTVADMKHQR